MKQNIFIFILTVLSLASYSQSINKQVFDSKYKDSLIVGACNISAFDNDIYLDWYMPEYEEYSPSDSVLSILKNKSENISIRIVFGLWCSDSRREIPRFFKILELLDFDEKNLTLIAVDTDKKALDIDISIYNISLVPTFIFYQKDKEIGRITESPKLNLEEDFLNIISKID